MTLEFWILVVLCVLAQRTLSQTLLLKNTVVRRRLLAVVDAPGLYGHELAHGLVALILGGAPSLLTIFPRKRDATIQGLSLGPGTLGATVHCTKRSLSAFVDAAPLLLPLAIYILPNDWAPLLRAWLAAQFIRYGVPSRHDLRQLIPAILALVLIGWGASTYFSSSL